MSTHNTCFRGEIRKISAFFGWKNALSVAMYNYHIWYAIQQRAVMLCMLGKIFSRWHTEIFFFLFFARKRILTNWFMWTVYWWSSLIRVLNVSHSTKYLLKQMYRKQNLGQKYGIKCSNILALVLLSLDMPCFANSVDPNQSASELIWIYTVCHQVRQFVSIIK